MNQMNVFLILEFSLRRHRHRSCLLFFKALLDIQYN